MKCHKIVLEARSPVFRALLTTPMREGNEGRVKVGGAGVHAKMACPGCQLA